MHCLENKILLGRNPYTAPSDRRYTTFLARSCRILSVRFNSCGLYPLHGTVLLWETVSAKPLCNIYGASFCLPCPAEKQLS